MSFTAHIDTTAEIARYKGTAAYNMARDFIGTVKTTVPSDLEIDAVILSLP